MYIFLLFDLNIVGDINSRHFQYSDLFLLAQYGYFTINTGVVELTVSVTLCLNILVEKLCSSTT